MGLKIKITPANLLCDWGEFEDWENGDSDTPTGWSKTGTPTIAKESTIKKYGSYSIKLIGTSTSQKIYIAIDSGTDYAGRTVKLGVWVYTSGAGVTLTIDDGVGTTNSSAHTGGGSWELLTITRQIDASATKLQVNLNIPNGVTAYFDNCLLVEGETLSLDLDSGNYNIAEFKPDIDIRSQNFELARKEGIYIPETHLGGKTIKLRGDVVGATAEACRTNYDELMKILRSWKEGERRELYLFDDRLKEVFLDKVGWNPRAALKMRSFDISFIADDPTMRYISRFRKKQVIASSSTSFNFAYNGNVESRPIIYFIADQSVDITSCLLENLTTGESVAFTGTVTAGNTLKIDCKNREIKNNNVDEIQYFTGDFLKLVPGTNYLKFTGSLCTVKVDWFDRWL